MYEFYGPMPLIGEHSYDHWHLCRVKLLSNSKVNSLTHNYVQNPSF